MSDFLIEERNPLAQTGDEEEKLSNIFTKASEIDDRGWFIGRKYYCTNCRKAIHNRPDNIQICKGHGCDCPCQTHYVGGDGMTLIPHGQKDTSL